MPLLRRAPSKRRWIEGRAAGLAAAGAHPGGVGWAAKASVLLDPAAACRSASIARQEPKRVQRTGTAASGPEWSGAAWWRQAGLRKEAAARGADDRAGFTSQPARRAEIGAAPRRGDRRKALRPIYTGARCTWC